MDLPDGSGPARPYDALGVLAHQEARLARQLVHHELYTAEGLLSVLWHGDPEAPAAVLAAGGAMGGLLGPADGFYQRLGEELASHGAGMLRIGYRRPGDLSACVHDVLACADIAARQGVERIVTMGHSFGGAPAIAAAAALGGHAAGVVTFATQSAGCEAAGQLSSVPMLLIHGERDRILPPMASEVVHAMAGGHGELVIMAGADHLLVEARDWIDAEVPAWVRAALAAR